MSDPDIERLLRHQQAVISSDFNHLKQCLNEAANRFADIAELMGSDVNYRPIEFLRASAKRYGAEANNAGDSE